MLEIILFSRYELKSCFFLKRSQNTIFAVRYSNFKVKFNSFSLSCFFFQDYIWSVMTPPQTTMEVGDTGIYPEPICKVLINLDGNPGVEEALFVN